MTIVVDASVAVSWVLADERTPLSVAARTHVLARGGVVPRLWWYEVRNVLVVAERRGRLTADAVTRAYESFSEAQLEMDDAASDFDILALARRHRLTFYDASYLELAKRRGCALASMDRELVRAAPLESVPLFTAEG